MSLPNDVCRCVNDTCLIRERCLRWQAFLDDREPNGVDAYISYARFRPRLVDHGNHVFTHECDNLIQTR